MCWFLFICGLRIRLYPRVNLYNSPACVFHLGQLIFMGALLGDDNARATNLCLFRYLLLRSCVKVCLNLSARDLLQYAI